MTDDLGRLRVLMGRMGLPQDTFSHLPPDEERRALAEFGHGLIAGVERAGWTMEDYVRTIDPLYGADPERVAPLPVRPIGHRRGGVR